MLKRILLALGVAMAGEAGAEAQGYRIAVGPYFYFYDAPMTLTWNRRNEVACTLR